MSVTIYHNPACSKSRETLQLLDAAGVETRVIAYLETPPSREELQAILAMLGMRPRELMRRHEAEYSENRLDDPALDDAALIDAMLRHPRLIERPIVIHNGKAVIGRPPTSVRSIL